MEPQFFQTLIGKKYYDHDFPELVRQLKRLNTNLEKPKALERTLDQVVETHLKEEMIAAGTMDGHTTPQVEEFEFWTSFDEFRKTLRIVSPKEAFEITGDEYVVDSEGYREADTKEVRVYGNGLWICHFTNGFYGMPLDNSEFHTKNIVELELRLFEYQLYGNVDDEAVEERVSRIQWLISLSRFYESMKDLTEKWHNLDKPEDAAAYYPDRWGSFHEDLIQVREWLEYQLSR